MNPAAASATSAHRVGRLRRAGSPVRLLLVAWALVTALLVMAGSRPPGAHLSAVTAALRRRLTQLRSGQAGRDAGLTTVEVAIITAVLLGLATALVAAITIVVNRNTSRIQ